MPTAPVVRLSNAPWYPVCPSEVPITNSSVPVFWKCASKVNVSLFLPLNSGQDSVDWSALVCGDPAHLLPVAATTTIFASRNAETTPEMTVLIPQ